MALNTRELEKKWIKKWEEAKIFEADPDKRKKFFVNAPYPYVNSYPHIGHLYTYMRTEAFARYKRHQGFNVLFPQGFHATGSPIVSAAQRVREKEPKQLQLLKDVGIQERDFSKFEKSEYWVEFFEPEFVKDFKNMGFSIDWRRTFHTTSLNPHYDKFIRWQFLKLLEKGYVVKEPFPVVWDPIDNCPVGDHDRCEGEGETPQEFLLVKHKLEDNKFIISATLRPDTILGITNLYVNPNVIYQLIQVTINEKDVQWILGKAALHRLEQQGWKVKKIGEINGKDLIGKETEEFGGYKVPILPAAFLNQDFGTGLVHSVPSDSADDLIALYDLQKNEELCKKYGLNYGQVKEIKVIECVETPGIGGNPADYFLKKYNVTSQQQRDKLENIKKEMYKLSFYTAKLGKKYTKQYFSKSYVGLKVEDHKAEIQEEIIKKGWAHTYYQLSNKVISRTLHECVVKIVDDQWFIAYGNEKWKRQVHKAFKKMKLYPEKVRPQFDYVIDWLKNWACTREHGLGTRLPWDDKWLIESLSDSTIYMAYYTIVYHLEKMPIEEVNDELFDYVFLGEGKSKSFAWDEMRDEFNYWYPFDFRNSGKDLIQNHLAFCVFNHTAIFPEQYWPKGFGCNGWVTVDGEKMSKSKGNIIALRDMPEKFSVDSARFTILSGGESLDDPNWDSNFARSIIGKLEQFHNFCITNYNKGRKEFNDADTWMESQLNEIIDDTAKAMEETLFRTATQRCFFDLQKKLRWYLRRTNNHPNKELLNKIIESQLLMLAPFTPFICEETWEKLGKKEYISLTLWPKVDRTKIDKKLDNYEEAVEKVIDDIASVMKIARIEKPKKITLFVADPWKYILFDYLNVIIKKTRNPGEVLKEVLALPELKKYHDQIKKLVPKLVMSGKISFFMEKPEDELKLLKKNKEFFEKEFGCAFEFMLAEKSEHIKALNALPEKPAILIE